MTSYLYRCPNCNRPTEDMAPLGKAKKWMRCRTCGGRSNRDYIFIGCKKK